MENKNKFDSKQSIIWKTIFNFCIALVALYYVVMLCLIDSVEFVKYIEHYIRSGTGISRGSSTIINVFYSGFGKIGVILFLILCNFILWWMTFTSLNRLRRYLHKEKLYKMGLVSNMDDDYKPVGLIKSIKQFFKKSGNTATSTVKYSRKDLRKMKKKLKDMENKRKR